MVLPAMVAAALYQAPPAQAATLVVNSTGHGTQADCNSSPAAYTTIAAAYAAAATGDTIFVCPGKYAERLTIARAITLDGAEAGVDARGRTGPETVLDAPGGDFLITVPGVTIDGFTFQGQTSTASQGGPITATSGGTTVVNNIFHGNKGASVLIDGPGTSGPPSSTTILRNVADSGISLAAVSGGTVSGNEILKPTSGYGLRLAGADSNLVVTGNWFVGGIDGIVVRSDLATPNSGLTITGNCIAGNMTAGLAVEGGGSSGAVQASANWWGSVNGPSGTAPGWGDAWVDPDGLISAGTFLIKPLARPCPQLPTLTVASPPPITEGRSGTKPLSFTIRLSSAYVARTQFAWTTVAGSARAGTDFVAANGTVAIPAGKRTATVTVRIIGDTDAEPTRHFTVALSSPVNAAIAGRPATATIRDSGTLPATGPGSSGGMPVGGIATGLARPAAGVGSPLLWGGLAELGLVVAMVAAAARLRGTDQQFVIPTAGAGCVVAIAAVAMLLLGGRSAPTPAAVAELTYPPIPLPAHQRPARPTTHHPQHGARPASQVAVSSPSQEASSPASPAAGSTARPALTGMRVKIPAIGVDAPVVNLGLNADSTLQVPSSPVDAGWWSGGTHPGEVGPAVIVGHVNLNGQQGVFGRLDQLRRGDHILVREANGAVDRYVVTGSAVYPKSRFPTPRVYGAIGYAGLRLITCTGSFDRSTGHYVDNLIVFARMTGHSKPGASA